jgi:hypothetical protein
MRRYESDIRSRHFAGSVVRPYPGRDRPVAESMSEALDAPTISMNFLTEDEFLTRMARAIYANSNRRNVVIVRGWQTLSPETQAGFIEAARMVIVRLDDEKYKAHWLLSSPEVVDTGTGR